VRRTPLLLQCEGAPGRTAEAALPERLRYTEEAMKKRRIMNLAKQESPRLKYPLPTSPDELDAYLAAIPKGSLDMDDIGDLLISTGIMRVFTFGGDDS
jgi:hypothetical protein